MSKTRMLTKSPGLERRLSIGLTLGTSLPSSSPPRTHPETASVAIRIDLPENPLRSRIREGLRLPLYNHLCSACRDRNKLDRLNSLCKNSL